MVANTFRTFNECYLCASLVLELFQLYLDIAGLQWVAPGAPKAPAGSVGENSSSSSSKGKHSSKSKSKTPYTTSSSFAPHIFTVAVDSFASVRETRHSACYHYILSYLRTNTITDVQLSNSEGILHLLNTELPKRGKY